MAPRNLTIHDLWAKTQPRPFKPNPHQEKAILHIEGPLFLTAGPGSGKTRVLLWRTLNLIVFHAVKPEEIFLSTFTEKAAFQLQEGLRSLLSRVTNITGIPYDLSRMYVGTVHSLCHRLLRDPRFSSEPMTPVLKDALDQYFYLSNPHYWKNATDAAGLSPETITDYFNNGRASASRHNAVSDCIGLFNRFSEERERVDLAAIKANTDDTTLRKLIDLYGYYKRSLTPGQGAPQTDFALLQGMAMDRLKETPGSEDVFKHVIIDEYQDTNTIQAQLFFKLATGHKNICVVGDDDQALYRFRGATVENFVQFPERCQHDLGIDATPIPLNTNYRSRKGIVEFYTNFMSGHDWQRATGGSYRIAGKDIQAYNQDVRSSVIASTPSSPEDVAEEIAGLVKQLIEQRKVEDPNQIAFLFPSFVSEQVNRMKHALEKADIRVYAPRAGRFLEVSEAVAIFGLFLQIFAKPGRGTFASDDYKHFHNWMDECLQKSYGLTQADQKLAAYIQECQEEMATVLNDYWILQSIVQQNHWGLSQPYDINQMKEPLSTAPGLSERAKQSLGNASLERIVQKGIQDGHPFDLARIINRVTSLNWGVLDLFYRLCGFDQFSQIFDLAETGVDEGPICNLELITQYLGRFVDSTKTEIVLTASFLNDGKFRNTFFMWFLFSLFRLGESEYEDAEDPFPKGRIPFLTIHQAKGLEFPVVVLGNPRKDDRGPQRVDQIVRSLPRRTGEPERVREPEDRIAGFDIMRMFYVALSRAKNLMVIAHFSGQGQRINEPFSTMLTAKNSPRISDFDLDTLPESRVETDKLAKNYSYTSDYLLYQKCPRQYMLFHKYGFVASRSQTQVFSKLVHKTIEDLHRLLIATKQQSGTNTQITQAIRKKFEENYTLLQAEGGHSLTQNVKHAARQQVLLYWRKMRQVAENITETEVRLSLPAQVTPKGRKFAIEGVVDIILQKDDRTVMYNIKTREADYVRANQDLYEKQLSIYAHIWQHLRQQSLDETAIIATSYPDFVKQALRDPQQLTVALEQWNPLIDIPLNPHHVEKTIRDFAEVVDKIEDNDFAPPPVEKLKTFIQGGGRQRSFATQVCRNCDARFSCRSYRDYETSSGGRPAPRFVPSFMGPNNLDPNAQELFTIIQEVRTSLLASGLRWDAGEDSPEWTPTILQAFRNASDRRGFVQKQAPVFPLDLGWLEGEDPEALVLALESELCEGLDGILYDFAKVVSERAPWKVMIYCANSLNSPGSLPNVLPRLVQWADSMQQRSLNDTATYAFVGFAHNPPALQRHLAAKHMYVRLVRHGIPLYVDTGEVGNVKTCVCRPSTVHNAPGNGVLPTPTPLVNNARNILCQCRQALATSLPTRRVSDLSAQITNWLGPPHFELKGSTGIGNIWFFVDSQGSLMYAGGKQNVRNLERYVQRHKPSPLPPSSVPIRPIRSWWCGTLLDAQELAQVNGQTIIAFFLNVIRPYI